MLDGSWFKKSVLHGYKALKEEVELLNRMNFFPISDGDTGTNLLTSLTPAVKVLNGVKHLGRHVSTFSEALFNNAKGSSGTILSFFFLGFAEALKAKEKADSDDIYRAFRTGAKWAYMAVERPVEGTMLTVARYAAKGLKKGLLRGEHIIDAFEEMAEAAGKSVERSPLLMALQGKKPATDSGALGFFDFLSGFLEGSHFKPKVRVYSRASVKKKFAGYCMNFWVSASASVEEIKKALGRIGEAVIVKNLGDTVKIHVHATDLEEIKAVLKEFGAVKKEKIEPMYVPE